MDLRRFRYYTRWHHLANRRAYEAPADPWKHVQVDPTEMTQYNAEIGLNWGLGRIEAGSWDRAENCEPVAEIPLARGLKQRFEQGYDWEETALYRRVAERFADGESVRGYESLDEFRSVRCEYLDELFHGIETAGYRPNAEAGHEGASAENAFEDAYAHKLEPLVVIGRAGNIYWTEGYHRLVIAQILDLESIPVQVLCRHADWQRIRDRIHGTTTGDPPPELEPHLDHPDLDDVLS